jgi:chemotaxis protein histidine kinase CheA
MTPPNKPLAMSDFFALEAGEYLERLDGALQKPDVATDEVVRLARALRGSALMANQAGIARAAAGVEALGRATRDGHAAWDAGTRQLAVRAVDDLKILVRRASAWTDADTAKAAALAAELEQHAGRPATPQRPAAPAGLDAGARAFVAREGAAIASALDRAGMALRGNPKAQDPLQHVLRAIQPLRGLAAVNDLPPLPDLLEGVERAVAQLTRPDAPPATGAGELLQAAGTAIARAAREVAEQGRPDPESPAFRQFAGLLVQLLDREPNIAPVSAFFYDDAGPHIVQQGVATTQPSTLSRLELVSQGEHLRQAADSLERAPSATQRELRAHTLAGTFRALAETGGDAFGERLARFAQAAREIVTTGVAVRSPQAFATVLRRAGDLLAQSEGGDEATIAGTLDQLVTDVQALREGVPAHAATAPAAPSAPAAPPAPAPTPTPAPSSEAPGLVGSWVVYEGLVAAGVGPASLDELLPVPSRDTARPAARTSGPIAAPLPPRAELPLVDVRSLLYRGDRARARAQELRAQARNASGDALRDLVEEVCDLIGLALEPGPPGS